MTVDELYTKQIRHLPLGERLRLLRLIAEGLEEEKATLKRGKRSLLELEGKGAEIWKDVDAQEYVNQLRDEWGDQ